MIISTKNYELNKRKIFVKCECGKTPEFLVTKRQFEDQVITNCGCILNYNHLLTKYQKIVKNKNNSLKLLSLIGKTESRGFYGIFECVCGIYFVTKIQYVTSSRTTSCGCLDYKRRATRNGVSQSEIYKKAYSSWIGLNYRCSNKNLADYNNYGGRGITVCNRWKLDNVDGFNNFINDLGLPNIEIKNPSVERIDVNGNYEPNNCKWIEFSEQHYNKRTTIITKDDVKLIRQLYKNKDLTLDELAIKFKCCRSNIEKIVYNVYFTNV